MEAVEDMKYALAAANGEKASEEETREEVGGAASVSSQLPAQGQVQGKADGDKTVHVTTMATSGDGESHDDAHGMVVHVTYQDICEFA